ncbi:transposase, IS607 family protein [Calothrix brevissima NIES-22]|nr:transposase, IS607 family protein [Calothrix brevissima NIES-22]
MLLGFKTQLRVNKQQRLLLAQHAGVARHAWNQGLTLCQQVIIHNKTNPEDKIKFPTAIDLHKWLVASIKSTYSWYYEVSKCPPQYALRQLSDAFKAFFQKNKGFRKFKKKGRHDSFTLDGAIHIDHRKVKVPVIGWLKTYENLPFGYQPKSVTISRQADKWFISWKIEVNPLPCGREDINETNESQNCVGVDLGINHLATLSTGEIFDGVKSYNRYEKKLARMQYLSRDQELGSNNYRKSQIKIARLHQKIANIRKDTLHKITTYLSKNHAVIGIEDLNVSGMLANGKLAKAIADMGFYEFRRQLEYKTKLYGSKLVVVDRFYPSSKTCSNCGEKKLYLSLSERIFKCEYCNFECDRDLNAARNLKQQAESGCVTVSVRPTFARQRLD